MCKGRTDTNTISKGMLDDSSHDSHDSHFSLFSLKSERGARQLPMGYIALAGTLVTLLCYRKAIAKQCRKSSCSSTPPPPHQPQPSSPPLPGYEMQNFPVHQARLPIFSPPIHPMLGVEGNPLFSSTPAHPYPTYQAPQASFNPTHPLVRAITQTLDRRSLRKKKSDAGPSPSRAAATQVQFDHGHIPSTATGHSSSNFNGILGEEDY
jgi:hypothetical protein